MMDENQKQPNYQNMMDRIRKEAKYSPLTAITMQLLKNQRLYKFYYKLSKKQKIPNWRNYQHIALRLAVLHWKLIESGKYNKEEAIKYIFGHLRENLEATIYQKYKNNHPHFLLMVNGKNSLDIDALWRVFKTNMDNQKEMLELLKEMYRSNSKGVYDYHQIKSMNQVMKIIREYANKYIHSTSQQHVSTEAELELEDFFAQEQINQSHQNHNNKPVMKQIELPIDFKFIECYEESNFWNFDF